MITYTVTVAGADRALPPTTVVLYARDQAEAERIALGATSSQTEQPRIVRVDEGTPAAAVRGRAWDLRHAITWHLQVNARQPINMPLHTAWFADRDRGDATPVAWAASILRRAQAEHAAAGLYTAPAEEDDTTTYQRVAILEGWTGEQLAAIARQTALVGA